MTSIQDHYFHGFSIPKLFCSEHSTFIIFSTHLLSFAHKTEEQRNCETSFPVFTSYSYCSQSPILRSTVFQLGVKFYDFVRLKFEKEKLLGNFFDFHTRTTRIFDKENKKCHYTLSLGGT